MKQDFIKFPLHLIIHPFDGYWDLKYEGKGKLRVAITILFLLFITMVIQRQFAGFLVNFNDPRTLNSLAELQYVVLPFILWCVSNWSITTLMEGEGKFSEIVNATAYALIPMILVYLPMTLISRFMTQEETAFYYLLNTVAAIWFIYLLFVGIMTVHQYTATKTIVTILLTIVVMAIIVFLGTLVMSLVQQIIEFVINIYRELIFRS
ncbi:Yip1 family protein [Paenibacillus urinalis]|uniref:Yip1 family protein n=1 Tax=Paenibacillus urinalis TaxID=521520 RepID=A0ABY7XEW5_9BACL|nr:MULTISPECIES: Yip1 family protein [Paenibacillus]WDH96101.1 Yip1 family protein [Paenibacillus urinalis]WDI04322.1 Yip1 family protein [Paenibacillus urinalis]GAK38344.1 sugar ABC transporter sugar-binding protein [Paenibacillus sp. TCA20]